VSARDAGRPFPDASLALTLAVVATFVAMSMADDVAGAAIGGALAFGGIGTLVARRVPEPAPLRLGLTPFPLRALAPVLLLVPITLLVSEIDNRLRLAFAAPPAQGLGVASVPAPEMILFMVLLNPVLEEFFYRGVLLQGCASALGRARAIAYVAALQILLVPAQTIALAGSAEPKLAVSAASQGVGILIAGTLCGLARVATGSLLPSVALNALIAGVGVASGALAERAPIPGFNAAGATTPAVYLVLAAASVALGVWLLARQLGREPELPPIPPPEPEDEEPGPLI
jgi:membrane protease YdiL (CAAX protease family)